MRKRLTWVPVVKIGRDAATGRFIPVAEAWRRPRTTVVERIRYRPRPVPVRQASNKRRRKQ
jgi:hypothetical protein